MIVYLVENDNHDVEVYLHWDNAFKSFESDLLEPWDSFIESNDSEDGDHLWVDGSVKEGHISIDDGPSIRTVYTLD